ncbi:hypothetical protein PT7_1344 [Pusillimonas sp. T7-7]|nr:hypothetical protein [Pusillimonas sp. T7-7]AEC19884.1 hypothetical protein PT7_1344 [Pusillimonas sp. T7-7]
MSLFKSSGRKKPNDSGLSLLQGLGILALIGIIVAVLLNYFA